MERFPNLQSEKKEKKTSFLEAGALAMAMIMAHSATATALELSESASWAQGVQAIKESVKNDKNEHQFTFLKYSRSGDGAWLTPKSGETDRVIMDLTDIATKTAEGVINGEISSVCIGHSHPPDEKHEKYFPSGDTRWKNLSSPPSIEDIRIAFTTVGVFSKYHIPTEKIEFFASDSRGIWYYDLVQESDFESTNELDNAKGAWTPQAEDRWFETFKETVGASLDPEVDIRITKEYAELQKAYRVNLTSSIRFVPYDELPSEPPCAGVHVNK